MVKVNQTQGTYGSNPDELKLQEYNRLRKKTKLTGAEQVRLNELQNELTKKGILTPFNGDVSPTYKNKSPLSGISLYSVEESNPKAILNKMADVVHSTFNSTKTEGVGNNQPANISISEESARNNVYNLANKAKNSQEYNDYQESRTALKDYYASHEEEIEARKQPYINEFNILFKKTEIMRSTYENSEAYQAAISAYEDFVQNFDGEIELDLGTEQRSNKHKSDID